ncbi:MAG: hypothetical protein ABI921_07485 [Panacibacter sp.]
MKNSKGLFAAFSTMVMLLCNTYYGIAQTGWKLTGNSGINPSTNFIGTLDLQPLKFRVNNIPAGEINSVNGNTAWGINTLLFNTTGTGNVAIGTNALYHNTTGRNLVAVGDSALFNYNTLLPIASNTAIGSKALFSATGAYRNTATGFQSLYSSTGGFDNTANGVKALYANISGNSNTGIGSSSLYANTTGIRNTAIGTNSMNLNTTGTQNTAVGFGANVGANNLNNATAIGANAIVSASNSLVLGNGANVGIGTNTPATKLEVQTADNSWGIIHTNGTVKAGLYVGASGGWLATKTNNPLYFCTSLLNTNFTAQMTLLTNGNLGIGTLNPLYKLSVNGTIQSKEVRVETGWADYVFEKDYKLRTLDNVAEYIEQNKHLPGIPSAKEIQKNGLAVGEVQTKMMEKIEELTLYIIDLQKQIDVVKNQK